MMMFVSVNGNMADIGLLSRDVKDNPIGTRWDSTFRVFIYLILNCNSRTKRLLNTIMVKEMYCKKFFFGSEITRTELVFFPLFRSTMQFVICRRMIFVSRVYWITKT